MTPPPRNASSSPRPVVWISAVLVTVGIFVALFVVGDRQGWYNSEYVDLTYENRTGETLCVYPTIPDAHGGRCLSEVRPNSEREWKYGCGDGKNADKNPLSIVIRVGSEGSWVYLRTEECRVWQESDRTLVIEGTGDDITVSGGPP